MRFAQLGRTGMAVSVIGFGASPLGNVFGGVSAEAANRTVAAAIDEGLNLFDVSPYYGLTLAEERLGQALAGRRESVYLATKCGRYGAAAFDFSAETITRKFEQSLHRLRTDHVDILQAHDIEFGSVQQVVQETLPAMVRLKEHGKVRHIGVTSYWPGLLARVVREFPVDCVLNYCHSNLFCDDMKRDLIPAANQAGVGVLNASPLHMGLLSDKPVPDWHPAPQKVRDAAAEVRELCCRLDVDPAMVAVRWSVDHSPAASTFVGLGSVAEVHHAVKSMETPIPEAVLDGLRTILSPVANTVWSSGLPENQDS